MKREIILGVLLFLLGNTYGQNIRINEVQYNNASTLHDEDGDTPDWIEIYNAGDTLLNLKGYMLTDNVNKNHYWKFPSVQIASHGYVVIYASGKDKAKGKHLHANFKLKQLKESVYLFSPDKELIDSIAAMCNPTNKTIARIPDGANTLHIAAATPLGSNNTATIVNSTYVQDTLWTDQQGGYYAQPLLLELKNKHTQNTIYYTLDGSDPDENSFRYSNKMQIIDRSNEEVVFANMVDKNAYRPEKLHKGTVVKAQVYSGGCPASNIYTSTFFIGTNPLKAKYTVSLTTDKNNLFGKDKGIYVQGNNYNYFQRGKNWEREAHIEIYDMQNSSVLSQDIGIRLHGNSTRIADQKSFKLYADDSFNYPFFDQKPHLSSFKTLMLKRSNTRLEVIYNDDMSNHLVENIDVDYCACETVSLYINGEYWGIYSLRERQDEHYIKNNYSLSDVDLDVVAYEKNGYVVEEGDEDNYNDLISFLKSSDPADENFLYDAGQLLDIENMIDFYVAQFYFANVDFPNNNLRMWRPRTEDGKWRFFFYDLDFGMEFIHDENLFEYTKPNNTNQIHPEFSTFILKTFIRNKAFADMFYKRFLELMQTEFSTEKVVRTIDEYKEIYAPLMPDHINRWGVPLSYIEWERHVERLRSFARQRPLVLKQQLHESFGTPITMHSNPETQTFSFNILSSDEKATIEVYNIQGMLMLKETFEHGEQYTLSHSLNTGIYLIKVTVGSNTYTEKMIL